LIETNALPLRQTDTGTFVICSGVYVFAYFLVSFEVGFNLNVIMRPLIGYVLTTRLVI